jgi:hypothetical protein
VQEKGGAAAFFTSVVLHAAIIGVALIVGFEAVSEARKPVAPLMVADWTPPPPAPSVTGAPPQLPLPGGVRPVSGPVTRGRTSEAAAAADAAQQLMRLEPEQRAALEARTMRGARSLGFGAAPADALRAAGFAADRQRVAFVLDASGAMVSALQAAQQELARRLAQLTPSQQYTVIVVRGDGCETAPETPALATRASLERTLRWLRERTEPRGNADLGAGLECAWKAINPDGVCIIARGLPPRRRAGNAPAASSTTSRSTLLATAERLNPLTDGRRGATFLCVELMDATANGALQQVGRTHGGPQGYQLLTRQDLGLVAKPLPSGTKP